METSTPRRIRRATRLIPIAAAWFVGCALATGGPPPPTPIPEDSPAADEGALVDWKPVEKLIAEQKFQAAFDLVETLGRSAQAANDVEDWTRALVEATQLGIALHGYEGAVEQLLETPWPDDPESRAVLDLYTAQAMVTYARRYSWEIRNRERVISDDTVDLKRWTHGQIIDAAHRAFARVWEQRDRWASAPLGDFSRYLDQNSYPPRIRGTLRDAVTYLWAELLRDSSLWRAGSENRIYQLDLQALAGGMPQGLDPGNSDRHALERLAFILGDLERWHLTGGRTEAALEARLTRIRTLHSSVPSNDDKQALRRGLQDHLNTIDTRYEWWAVGQATVATFLQQEAAIDALIRARVAALEGLEHHESGPGAQMCRRIVAEIEAPQYGVSAMEHDGIGRRSFRITHRNLDAVFFRAYRLDLETILRTGKDYNLLPGSREIPDFLERTPDFTWSVDLAPTTDFRSHATDHTPPVTEKDAYLIVTSAREDFAASENRRTAFTAIFTDLVLVKRAIDGRWEITARRGETGDPLPGVPLELWQADWRRGHSRVETFTTGEDGRAVVPIEAQNHRHFVFARSGDDIAFDDSVRTVHDREPSPVKRALLYTDRSVYRPNQTIYWKVLPYAGSTEDYRFRSLADTSVTVSLRDANRDEVLSTTVTTNDFGSVSGSFDIPAGRMLGRWTLQVESLASTAIRVEEYKRPTFTVEITDPEAPLRLNRPAELSGTVQYYFGLPVTEGSVSWKVTREPVYPRWWSWWFPAPSGSPEVVASGDGTTDGDGHFTVVFDPSADEREAERGVTYRFRLSVEATDPGGETRSADRSFRLGFSSIEANIDLGGEWIPAHATGEASILRSDLDGTPRSGAGTWRLVGLGNPPKTLTPAEIPVPVDPEDPHVLDGDRTRSRWNTGFDPERLMGDWPVASTIGEGTLEHGPDGRAAVEIPALKPGAYRLIYTTEDAFGTPFEAQRNFLIGGPHNTRVSLPAFLGAEQPTVAVGDTARLFVHSGFPGQEMVLELTRQGRRIDRRIIRSRRDAEIIEIPVTDRLRGGFGAKLTLVRDHQLTTQQTQVFVPWDDRKLTLEFETFRDRLRPGQKDVFRVRVRSADGTDLDRGTAEVLASMYDRSLDLFAPLNPPAVDDLYPSLIGWTDPDATLGTARLSWLDENGFHVLPSRPYFTSDRLRMLDGYGIGGPGGRRGGILRMKAGAPAPVPDSEPMAETQAVAESSDDLQAFDTVGLTEEITREPSVPESEIRSNFAETAFFLPHLVPEDDGSVMIEFETPDSVTEWNLWVHAVTRDLRGASEERRVKTVKELMVRPAVPRFLREGDRADLRVVVNNAGDEALEGVLKLELTDGQTGEDLRPAFDIDPEHANSVPFTVEPGQGTTLSFPMSVPPRPGPVTFTVTATAGDFSDGEARPLPVLPGRIHLMQSRFAALRDTDRRELTFADMEEDDPTRINDQLVVSIDAQLFYGVLDALPYLIDYPYECTEQTLNRFLSTGIVTSVFDDYPAVRAMAETLAARDTRLEAWDADDPNRKIALEETPWLVESRGGDEKTSRLINVLDPNIADAQRRSSLSDLAKVQTSLGAFPWWPGGPPSPYMTLYVLAGFSRALEFGVDVPKPLVVNAWSYMHRHYLDDLVERMVEGHCCPEMITWLNFVLSSYPDPSWTSGVFTEDDRRRMLDHSFAHWKRHSPRLKATLALTLKRAGRDADARLVWDSVMDSAKTDRDLGTYWAAEDRSWLWYNDTIETHAVALRALTELDPDDERRLGLVQWIFLNKKLNHWESTRTTAEVIYSLVHYLEHEDQLGAREEATVTVGPVTEHFVFEPDAFTGKDARIVIPGPEVDTKSMGTTVVEKSTPGLAFATATWHFSTEQLPDEGDGDLFSVERTFYRRNLVGSEYVLEPMTPETPIKVGEQLEVEIRIKARHAAEYVHLRSPRGAGFEPESVRSGWRWDTGVASYEEIRDSGSNHFFEWLPAGEYTLRTRLRATMAGRFKVAPAVIQSMYAPEFGAYSAGRELLVEDPS